MLSACMWKCCEPRANLCRQNANTLRQSLLTWLPDFQLAFANRSCRVGPSPQAVTEASGNAPQASGKGLTRGGFWTDRPGNPMEKRSQCHPFRRPLKRLYNKFFQKTSPCKAARGGPRGGNGSQWERAAGHPQGVAPEAVTEASGNAPQATRKGWPYYIRGVRAACGGVVYRRATPCGWPVGGAGPGGLWGYLVACGRCGAGWPVGGAGPGGLWAVWLLEAHLGFFIRSRPPLR